MVFAAVTLSPLRAQDEIKSHEGTAQEKAAPTSTVPQELVDLCKQLEAEQKRALAEAQQRSKEALVAKREFQKKVEAEIVSEYKNAFVKEAPAALVTLIDNYQTAIGSVKALFSLEQVDLTVDDLNEMIGAIDGIYNAKVAPLQIEARNKLKQIFKGETFRAHRSYCEPSNIAFNRGSITCDLNTHGSIEEREGKLSFWAPCRLNLGKGCVIWQKKESYVEGRTQFVDSEADEALIQLNSKKLPAFCQKLKELENKEAVPHAESKEAPQRPASP